MAQWLNPETGEYEEKPEEGTNAFSTGGAVAVGPGLPSQQTQIQQPTWSFDGGDWARQNESGIAQFKNLDGTWSDIGRGEHAESQGYIGSAVNDPNVDKLVAYQRANPNYLNNEQQSFFSNPIGMLDSYGQGNRWGMQDLFDNKFNDQQAGFLAQTGGRGYLSPSDIASGEAFNFRESAAEQSKRAEADSGFLGLGSMGIPLALAAMYFTGPAGAGLWGAEAGAGLAAGGMEGLAAADFAGGLIPEFGTGLGYSAGLGIGDGIGTMLGDPSYWASSLGDSYGLEGLSSISELPAVTEIPNSVANMETGFRELSQLNNPTGWNSSPLNPDVSALENAGSSSLGETIEPKQFIDDWGRGTNAAGDMVNAQGNRAWQDVAAEKLRGVGVGRDTAGSMVNGGSKMLDFMTSPIGGGKKGIFSPPTPLGMAGKGLSAIFDMKSNKDAMDFYKTQMDQMNGWTDPNRARGDQANAMWLQNYQNPTQAFNEFMMGTGRDLAEQQRRQAAQGGHRGNYLNTGKDKTDLLAAFMKQQLARGDSLRNGFANGTNNYASSAAMAPAMASMIRNQYAPIGQAVSSIDRGFSLSDIFGEG